MPKVADKGLKGAMASSSSSNKTQDNASDTQNRTADPKGTVEPNDPKAKSQSCQQPGLITGLLRAAASIQRIPKLRTPVALPTDFLGPESGDSDDEMEEEHGWDGFSHDPNAMPMHMMHDDPDDDQNFDFDQDVAGPSSDPSMTSACGAGKPAGNLLSDFLISQDDSTNPVTEDVASVVTHAWLTQHKDMAEVFAANPRPSNIPIFKTDVNEEIIQAMDSKVVRSKDMRLRSAQGAISSTAVAITNILESLTKMESAPTPTIRTHLTDMVQASVGGLKLLSHANMNLNNQHRNNFKTVMSPKYHGLCKDIPNLPSAHLFGDQLGERLRSMSQAAALGKSIAYPKWKGKQQAYSHNRYQPYGRGTWRGSHANAGKSSFLAYDVSRNKLSMLDDQCMHPLSFPRADWQLLSKPRPEREPQRQEGQQQETHQLIGHDLTSRIVQSVSTGVNPGIDVSFWPEYKAGRISECNSHWATITSDPINSIILRHVRGLQIDFVNTPVQDVPPKQLYFTNDEHKFLKAEIGKLLGMKVIEKVECSPNHFISQIFLRPKKQEGKFRLILNLRELNENVEYHHFKMDSLTDTLDLVTQNNFMMSLDLKDAYYSVKVQPSFRKFLRFEYEDELFQFTCLPNGLSSGPRVFAKIMKVPLSHLRVKDNVNISCYIDDIFISGNSYSECLESGKKAALLLQQLGFTISEKSVLQPTQKIEHVGFVVDSRKMQVSLPNEKVNNILKFIDDCLQPNYLTIRQVAQLLGTLEATKPGNRYAMLFTKNLAWAKNEAFKANGYDFDKFMLLPDMVRDDLNWWCDNLSRTYRMMFVGLPNFILFTDASKSGWGCYSEQMDVKTGGKWTPGETLFHINVLELMAVLNSLKSLCRDFKNTHIRIMTDNTTTMLTIQNQGSVRSRQCNKVVP